MRGGGHRRRSEWEQEGADASTAKLMPSLSLARSGRNTSFGLSSPTL
jgi:hypothetical protein